MNAQDFLQKREDILFKHKLDDMLTTGEALEALNRLDAEYKRAQSNPYYDFVNHAENLIGAIKLCEGQPQDMHAPIDALVSHLMRYKAQLPHGGE